MTMKRRRKKKTGNYYCNVRWLFHFHPPTMMAFYCLIMLVVAAITLEINTNGDFLFDFQRELLLRKIYKVSHKKYVEMANYNK